MIEISERQTFSIPQAARILGIHEEKIRAEVKRGRIKVVPLLDRNKKIPRSEIERLLAGVRMDEQA